MSDATKQEARCCPGEKVEITLAICRARQANNYPKCLLCKHYVIQPGEAQTADPRVKASIFRTTSVAGRVPSEFNEYVVRKVGTAAAQFLRAESAAVSSIVAACDLRENSRSFCRIFCEGAGLGGLHTTSIGVVPPEVLRFVMATGEFGAGAFISGCHAPENTNGIRLYRRSGLPLTYENGLDKIGLIARRTKPSRSRASGEHHTLEALSSYRSHVLKFVGKLRPATVVVDASCGVAASLVPYVFEKLPVRIVPVHFEQDGRSQLLGKRFPAPEVQSAVQEAIARSGAVMGVAIDFDGDIAAFFNETGAIMRNDLVSALIASELLSYSPGGKVAYDLRFTAAVREEILKAKGKPLPTSVDPLALTLAVLQKEAIYAADMTGRHFFRDVFGAESPMLAMLLMCSALSRKGEALSKMAGELARYSHSGELRYEMPSPEAAAKAIEELAAQFRDAETEKVDGLTVRLADWWFNLRQPGGSTSLRLCVEGRSNADLRRGTMAIERAINKHLQQKPS